MSTRLPEPSTQALATVEHRARRSTSRTRVRRTRSAAWLEAALVICAATLASIAYTWPLATKLGTVVHDLYDPVVHAWTIDWVQHTIGTLGKLFDANIFLPERNTLAYSDPLLGLAIPLLPLRWLGLSPVSHLNVAVIAGTTLTAASAYVFGRVVTRSRAVGALCGAAFAFGPLPEMHLGHVQTIWRAGIPLAGAAVWNLADRAEQQRPTWPAACGLFAALAWQVSVAFHPAAYAFVVAGVALAFRWRSLGRRGWLATALALVAAVSLSLLVAQPYLANADRFDNFEYGLATVRRYGADFTSTDPKIWLWGPILGRGTGWPAYGGSSFPGAVLIVLAFTGLIAGWRDRSSRRPAVFGAVLVVIGFVLALGTSDRGWKRYLPYRVLYEWVPGWGALRAADRAALIGLLGLALLGGLGARSIGRWLARRGLRFGVGAVVGAAVLAILVEGYAPWTNLPTVRVSAVDEQLARRRERGAVVYLPANATGTAALDLSLWDQPVNMYGTTAHHRRTPNGFASYIPASYARTFARLLDLPSERALRTLRALGVRYVVVRHRAAGGAWDRLLDPEKARPLELVGRFGGDLLYEVPT